METYSRGFTVVTLNGRYFVVAAKEFTGKSVFDGFVMDPNTLARASEVKARHDAVLSCNALTDPKSLVQSDFDPDGREFGGKRVYVRRQLLQMAGGASFNSAKNIPTWRGRQGFRFVELLTLMVNINGVETAISETRPAYLRAQVSWKVEAKHLPPMLSAPVVSTPEMSTGLAEIDSREHRVVCLHSMGYEVSGTSSSDAPAPELKLGAADAPAPTKQKRTALYLFVVPVVKDKRGTVADGTMIPIGPLAAGTASRFGSDPKGPYVRCSERTDTSVTFEVFGDRDESFVFLGSDFKAQVVDGQACQVVTVPIENGELVAEKATFAPKNRRPGWGGKKRAIKPADGTPDLDEQMRALRQMSHELQVPGLKTKANAAFRPADTALKARDKAARAHSAAVAEMNGASDSAKPAAEAAVVAAKLALDAANTALLTAIGTAKTDLEAIKASAAPTEPAAADASAPAEVNA